MFRIGICFSICQFSARFGCGYLLVKQRQNKDQTKDANGEGKNASECMIIETIQARCYDEAQHETSENQLRFLVSGTVFSVFGKGLAGTWIKS